MKTHSLRICPAVLVGIALTFCRAASAQTFWIDGIGDWFDPFNWSAGVPDPASGTSFDARIDNGGIAQIFAPGASVRRITLGALNGQSGGVLIDAGTLDVTQNLHLGESGQGVVTIRNGSTITSNFTRLGRFGGSSGIATVSDEGTSWSTAVDFLVGESGSGALVVREGGDVVVGSNFSVANVGGAPQSNVTVTGAGSTLNSASTFIGSVGTGVVTVEAGGELRADAQILVNRFASGNGTLTVTGAGSQAITNGELRVADEGVGLLQISDGGQVTSGRGILGNNTASANGSALVTGAGSVWSITGDLFVSNRGVSSLRLENGGNVVNTGGSYTGFVAGSSATGLVDGAGSIWDMNFLQVGGAGTVTLTISNGGSAITRLAGFNSVSVGEQASGNGTITVTGGGSTWTNAGSMVIGTNGHGTLNIEAGGVVTAGPNVSIGYNSGAVGNVTVNGAGSQLNVPGELIVGGGPAGSGATGGSGTLAIVDGGVVNVASGAGRVTVSSASWGNISTLRIGTGAGAGVLEAGEVALTDFLSQLEFNHTDNTTFSVPITGAGFVSKFGTGTTTLNAVSTFTGGLNVNAGVVELRAPGDLANALPISVAFGAEFQLFDSTSTRAQTVTNGGRVKFFDTSVAGTAAITNYPTSFQAFAIGSTVFAGSSNAENATLTNLGATSFSNEGAATAFEDTASAGSATINNEPSPVGNARRQVGSTSFNGFSTAADAQIFNNAATTTSGGGGLTEFYLGSNAGNATITSRGATVAGYATNGGVEFAGLTAGTATFLNEGATVNGGKGGVVYFYIGDGGNATFRNFAGTVSGALGGDLEVQGFSGANVPTLGSAAVDNFGATVAGAKGGTTLFQGNASAGSATVIARGAGSASAGTTAGTVTFTMQTTAESASFDVRGGEVVSAPGGSVEFVNTSTAANAAVSIDGATQTNFLGGSVTFKDTATAGAAAITAHGGGPHSIFAQGTPGGLVTLRNNATGGTATFTMEAGAAAGGAGAKVQFFDSATAGSATFMNLAAAENVTGASGGSEEFYNTSTAGNAIFTNEGAKRFNAYFAAPGSVYFTDQSSAGAATFTNLPSTEASANGGAILFAGNSTGGTATITNSGGALVGGGAGYTYFSGSATGGNATIYNQGAVVAGGGRGTTYFDGSSSAGNSMLYIEAGVGVGGAVIFQNASDGGTARAVLAGTGVDAGGLDLSLLTTAGMGIGSIEGDGVVSLGAKYLTVGTNNLDTAYSGLIRDGGYSGASGGGLTKVGTGTLTFTSPNTYTGATSVIAGTLRVSETTGQALSNSWTYVGPGSTLEFAESGRGGSNSVINIPSSTANGYGGRLSFRNTASAGSLQVSQSGTTFSSVFTEAETYFDDFSTAGDATFRNFGGQAGGNAHGGAVFFLGNASAGNATFNNEGGAVAGAGGGFVTMARDSRGGTAHFNNLGTSTLDSRGLENGGTVYITERADAENATFTNHGGTASGGSGGGVSVSGTASAGSATFTNLPGAVAGAPGGQTRFSGNSTAAFATITSEGATGSNINPGETRFSGQSTAGSATIVAKGGAMHNMFAAGTPGGLVTFNDTAHAGNATFTGEAGTAPGGAGGTIEFRNNSSAENSTFTLLAPTVAGGISGGSTEFYNTSTAGNATFTTEGAKNFNAYFGATGSVIFFDQSTAGSAMLTNLPATAGQANGGFIGFTNSATAGTATLTNRGGAIASTRGGDIAFFSSSTAENSSINVLGGEASGAFGSSLRFNDTSTAGDATVLTLGGLDGAGGGSTRFFNSSSGGNAAFITVGNGLFDISFLASSGTTAGSIAGSGNYSLGSKSLTVGSLNTDTTISGFIYGAGGTLTKVGTATLTIDALQSYTTLNADEGETILNTALGTGSSTANVNAAAYLTVSQKLAALNIGAGALVTLGPAAAGVHAVPEPAALSLLSLGILTLLRRR